MYVYGINNCDTVRKALRFFKEHNISYEMVDLKKNPVGCDKIDQWMQTYPVEEIFNKRGSTYRKLNLKSLNLDHEGMREWLCRENMLIKRPVVETDNGKIIVGFDETIYKETFL